MKRLASLGVLVLIALLGIPAGPVDAAPGAAPTRFGVSVDTTTLRSGQTLTATGTANSDCAWIIDWNNERRSRSARTIVARFVAPEVEKKTVIPLRGTCFYVSPAPTTTGPKPPTGGPGQAAQTVTVTVPKSLNQTILITVLPSGTVVSPPDDGNGNGGGPGGDLPDTGGPDLWILLAGLATLLVGASLIKLATSQDGRLQVLR